MIYSFNIEPCVETKNFRFQEYVKLEALITPCLK